MKEDLLKVLNLLEKLARAVERGDINTLDLRKEMEDLYIEIKSKQFVEIGQAMKSSVVQKSRNFA